MNCPGQGEIRHERGSVLLHAVQPAECTSTCTTPNTAAAVHAAAEQLAVQVLRRHAQLEPVAAGALRRHVPVPQRRRPIRPPGSRRGTNCTHLHEQSRLRRPTPITGTPMLPAGKYVVEMVVPPGYELVKEEDKNILIGDNYIAPVTQQFGGLGNIFILPDQAEVGASLQRQQSRRIPPQIWAAPPSRVTKVTPGSVETFWPCVGAVAHRSRLHQPVPAVR